MVNFTYTAWLDFNPITNQPVNIYQPVAEQLYHLRKDRNENENLSDNTKYKYIKNYLNNLLVSQIIRL
mgnify:CR=1 FL=1